MHVDCPLSDDVIKCLFLKAVFYMPSLHWNTFFWGKVLFWTCLTIHNFFFLFFFLFFIRRLHSLRLTIPCLNAKWVGTSGLDDPSLALQMTCLGSGHSSFEWQEGRQVCTVFLSMSSLWVVSLCDSLIFFFTNSATETDAHNMISLLDRK